MIIAVSGTHFIGKSTLIEDFIAQNPSFTTEMEAYYKLEAEQSDAELLLEPSYDSLLEQLDCSLSQLLNCPTDQDIIFDRCPVDFLAYAMCLLEEDDIDINDSEISERFEDIKEALDRVDLIVFLPIGSDSELEYSEENPEYRDRADYFFKQIYREEACDIFPQYNHPRIVEISGDRDDRVATLENIVEEFLSNE